MFAIGSLFSGIGALELGLEWAGLGPTLWQVERDPWCRRLLAARWPDAARHSDVRRVTGLAQHGRHAVLPCVDVLVGGFPCQDVSSAGKRAGLAGARSGLWSEFARLAGELKPRWIVVENVASGAGRWVDAVVGELEQLGYDALPLPIAARDVGAPHRRGRVFVVARLADAGGDRRSRKSPRHRSQGALEQQPRRVADGRAPRRGPHGGDAQPVVGRGADGTATWLDGNAVTATKPLRWPSRRGQRQRTWEPERTVPPSALRDREQRLKALGNAVVPQCAEVAGWFIRELEQMQKD